MYNTMIMCVVGGSGVGSARASPKTAAKSAASLGLPIKKKPSTDSSDNMQDGAVNGRVLPTSRLVDALTSQTPSYLILDPLTEPKPTYCYPPLLHPCLSPALAALARTTVSRIDLAKTLTTGRLNPTQHNAA